MALPEPNEIYTTRAAALRQDAAVLRGRARILSNARLGTFLLFVVAGVFAELGTTLLWIVAAAAAIAFVVLVVQHRRCRAQIQELEARAALCDLGLARRARDWKSLPVVVRTSTISICSANVP
jgi:Flp pilus assembly protein TadB